MMSNLNDSMILISAYNVATCGAKILLLSDRVQKEWVVYEKLPFIICFLSCILKSLEQQTPLGTNQTQGQDKDDKNHVGKLPEGEIT